MAPWCPMMIIYWVCERLRKPATVAYVLHLKGWGLPRSQGSRTWHVFSLTWLEADWFRCEGGPARLIKSRFKKGCVLLYNTALRLKVPLSVSFIFWRGAVGGVEKGEGIAYCMLLCEWIPQKDILDILHTLSTVLNKLTFSARCTSNILKIYCLMKTELDRNRNQSIHFDFVDKCPLVLRCNVYWPNQFGWRKNVHTTLKTCMLLSWCCLFRAGKDTCRQDSISKSIETSFEPPLFSLDRIFTNSVWASSFLSHFKTWLAHPIVEKIKIKLYAQKES